jgi:hypothetical protein
MSTILTKTRIQLNIWMFVEHSQQHKNISIKNQILEAAGEVYLLKSGRQWFSTIFGIANHVEKKFSFLSNVRLNLVG